jgi:hypothetical protein
MLDNLTNGPDAGPPSLSDTGIDRIKGWVQWHWRLDDSTVVMVTQLRCHEPGCPPIETVIALLPMAGARWQTKLHKAPEDVTEADIQACTPEVPEA